jgi:hypothetical protein
MSDDQQESATEQVVVRITTVGEITKPESAGFTIPNYQRGFAWEKKEVEAFIESIEDVNTPFLGNFIIHEEAKDGALTYNLVDGQQRMTCILMAIGATKLLHLDEGHQFSDSIKLLRQANDLITKSISEKDKTELRNKKIQLTIVDDIDLAFTFYDNANTAGQPLQAKDIIKSRHLLAMSQNQQGHLMVEAARIWKEMEKQGDLTIFLYHLWNCRNLLKRKDIRFIWQHNINGDYNLNAPMIKEFAGKKSIMDNKPGSTRFQIPKHFQYFTFVNDWQTGGNPSNVGWLGSIDMHLEPGWLTFKYMQHCYLNFCQLNDNKDGLGKWFTENQSPEPKPNFQLLNQLSKWAMMILKDIYKENHLQIEKEHQKLRNNLAYLVFTTKNIDEYLLGKQLPNGYALRDIFYWFGEMEFKRVTEIQGLPNIDPASKTSDIIANGWDLHKERSTQYLLDLETKEQA